jgi:Golgi SNAP receptor complex protein 1
LISIQIVFYVEVLISVPVMQMDTVISQAQATLGALVLQRSTFGGINSKLSNIGSRLPSV